MRALKVGDRVIDRNAGPGRANAARSGVVVALTSANPPWHDGGRPYVQPDDGTAPGYWHYAELESQ